MSGDKEKFTREIVARQSAEDIFSVNPLQNEIDKKLRPDRRPFTLRDLKRFSKLANSALNNADTDNPYTTEVFINMHEGDYVYDMQTDPPRRVEHTGEVLYGYVNGFMVTVPTGASEEVFAAAFEKYNSDVSVGTHSYLVPMAVNNTNYGVRVADAPAPIGENRVEVSTQDMYHIDQEDVEQDTIHSLLNIIEDDLFEEDTIRIDTLEESIGSLQRAGFIKKLDDMTTACNYYLQLCLHNFYQWTVTPNTVMELFDRDVKFNEHGKRKTSLKWVSDELTVVGIDLHQKEGESVGCTIYAQSEEGLLYRSCAQDDKESLILFREEDSDDSQDNEDDE